MTTYYYGLNNTSTKYRQEDVVEGTSTGSTDIEVRIDGTKNWKSIQNIIEALEAIDRRLRSGKHDIPIV